MMQLYAKEDYGLQATGRKKVRRGEGGFFPRGSVRSLDSDLDLLEL